MKRLLILLAGCGDPTVAPVDAPFVPQDAPAACTAKFSGNFVETSTTDDACATDGMTLSISSTFLVEPLQVSIPAASAGDYSSQTVAEWSAMATRMINHDTCLMAAGDQVVPHGSFTLHLESVSPSHGTLVLDQPVRATVFSDCGATLVEHVEVTF